MCKTTEIINHAKQLAKDLDYSEEEALADVLEELLFGIDTEYDSCGEGKTRTTMFRNTFLNNVISFFNQIHPDEQIKIGIWPKE